MPRGVLFGGLFLVVIFNEKRFLAVPAKGQTVPIHPAIQAEILPNNGGRGGGGYDIMVIVKLVRGF